MVKNEKDKASDSGLLLDSDTEAAVEALGRAIHSNFVYGVDHPVTRSNADQSYDLLMRQFERVDRIDLSRGQGALMVNGRRTSGKSPLIKSVIRIMEENAISSFSVSRGMELDEFRRLLEILVDNVEGSFGDRIGAEKLKHVSSRKFKYEEVSEEGREGELNRSEVEKSPKDDIKDMAEEWLASVQRGSEKAQAPASGAGVEQIVAFLKGDVSLGESGTGEALADVASDPEKLAKLIMEATVVRQSLNDISSGESIGDLVIGCLRRTYEGLRKQVRQSDKTGQIDIGKSLLLLEKNIIDKLHRVMGTSDAEVDDRIRAAIREMGENADIEHLAQEYMHQSALLKNNEKRIVEYIRSQDRGALERNLMDAGLSGEAWRSLVAKSSKSDTKESLPASGISMPGGLGALAVVMARFDELMTSTAPKADEIASFIDEIEEQVQSFESNTQRKIDLLAEEIKFTEALDEDHTEVGDHRKRFSDFVEILAELVQELLQPLTVVNCSLNMVISGYTGELSPEQSDMLELATNSANRLANLIDRITELVGYPKTLHPTKK